MKNKNIRRFLICSALTVHMGFAHGQELIIDQAENKTFTNALELYKENKFPAALQQFEKILNDQSISEEFEVESAYFRVICLLRTHSPEAGDELIDFIETYPASNRINSANLELARYYFQAKKYNKALDALEETDPYYLTEDEKTEFYYTRGYCLLQEEELDKAAADFYEIKDGNHLLSTPAIYYWGHINYSKGNYETARKAFDRIKDNPQYGPLLPYYYAQILFQQGEYDQVIEYGSPLIEDESIDRQEEIARLTGDAYFMKKDYRMAAIYLEKYLDATKKPDQDVNYKMAYCLYKDKNYADAIDYFKKCTSGKNELAQNAYYHLADCYVKINNKKQAMVAFDAASNLPFDETIREDALFNYAKLTYELSYSPLNEAIKAFDKYISLYPNSERNDVAYDYLQRVFMTTRNYKDAMATLEKIKVKSPSIKKAYQRVAYLRGLELFKNLKFEAAIESFKKSLEYGIYNQELKALAYYWTGEAWFHIYDWDQSIANYRKFLDTPGAYSLKEYPIAMYNSGYAYFKKKDFASAQTQFRKFLEMKTEIQPKYLADAYNRIGDMQLLERDFEAAIESYSKTVEMNNYEADYALFKKAFCHGLLNANQQKVFDLYQLKTKFPESPYLDDALYESGRAYEKIDQYDKAIFQYNTLLKNHPQSPYASKTLLQLGLLFFNKNDLQKSMSYYKKVVEDYPDSQEAKTAMMGIKNVYVELNDVNGYFVYANASKTQVQTSSTEKDSLTYQAAEKLYLENSPAALTQINRYLEEFPDGNFALNAHFYKGELHYKAGEFFDALKSYEYVIERPDNLFSENALANAGGIYFSSKQYDQALKIYTRLEIIAGNKWNRIKARAGQLRCNYELKNWAATLEAGEKLLNTSEISEALKRETNYKMAKAYLETGDPENATELFKTLAEDTKTSEGAEAKYILAHLYFKAGNAEKTEAEIMDFIDKGTPYQYWLAKSFILLADTYMLKGDSFQALHTLKSVVENYTEKTDGILEEANRRLERIEASQKETEKPESTNEEE